MGLKLLIEHGIVHSNSYDGKNGIETNEVYLGEVGFLGFFPGGSNVHSGSHGNQ